MAVLNVTTVTRAGAATTGQAAAGGGDSFPNDGKTLILVNNGHSSAQTVTPRAYIDGALRDLDSVSVPNAASRFIGPWPTSYNDTSGRINLSYSGVTSLTVLPFTQ